MASKIIFVLLFIVDLLMAAFLGWSMIQTHLVPNVAVIIAVSMLVLIPLLLFFLQREKKNKKKTGFRIAAIAILLFLGLVEGAVGFYLHQYNNKMDKVLDVHVQYTQVEVYVKGDDRAQTIEYAVESEYVFGVIAGADEEAIAQTRAEMEEKYGRTLRIQSYAGLADLVRALDEGQVDALLMSSAYLGLIEGLPDYEDYAESLRVLLSTNVQTEMPELMEIVPQTLQEGGESQPMKDPELWKDCFCAYASGIDTYGPVTARSRSDVNILVIVNTRTKTVLLLSTPRDYYVPFNFSPANGALDKLTHAGIYGIEGSMRALSDLYGVPVHYYLRVNFTGFINVINTLGGVDFESDTEWGKYGYYIRKGMNYNVKGEAALRFVRDRKSFADGDRARSRHQMAVIKGIINGLKSSKIITNYSQLMDDMAGCFQSNASKAMVGDLVQLTIDPNKPDWTVLTYNVDGNGRTDYAYSLGAYAYCMIPNENTVEYAKSLISAVLAGEPLTQEELQKNAPDPRGDK